ncbi:MAG: hypothetical protein LAP40_22335 [Acidobacteriia bacterium]|nr:hypothetical protein [Terriglobia bacterium]
MACAAWLSAQTPAAAPEPGWSFTATSANVAGAPDSIRIDILRWSTDAERDKLMAAWNMKGGAGAPVTRAAGRGGARAGRGGGRGGRGAAADDAPPATPESTLAAALQESPTVGYLWSSEVAGYALRYAAKRPAPEGGQRILLITERRLGASNDLWKPAGPDPPSPYAFSVIELRVNAKGLGEGKVSLTGKIAPDPAAQIVAPENYESLPVVFSNLKRHAGL